MGKKKDKTYTAITVGQLKELLSKIDDSLPIGVVGHFGEFNPVHNISDFCRGEAYLVPDGESWRNMDNFKSDVFLIPEMDIGPDPD
jgi:hypothetical protein